MPKLILDASPVICWCEELEDSIVFDTILESDFTPVIPERVLDEIESDNEIASFVLENSKEVNCDEGRFEELSNRFFRLGSGEKAVLAIGEQYEESGEEYYCVLDDGVARTACDKLDLELIGTIGLLGDLIDRDLIDFQKSNRLIEEMKKSGTRLPDNHAELLRETANTSRP